VAARLARQHVARAAWANDGKGVPPSPKPACLLAGDEVGHAAKANAGRVTWLVAAWRQAPGGAATASGGRLPRQHAAWRRAGMAHFGHGRQRAGVGCGGMSLPSLAQAARATCRLARRAATDGWSFLTNLFKSGLF
jgi:hypothetical protein